MISFAKLVTDPDPGRPDFKMNKDGGGGPSSKKKEQEDAERAANRQLKQEKMELLSRFAEENRVKGDYITDVGIHLTPLSCTLSPVPTY